MEKDSGTFLEHSVLSSVLGIRILEDGNKNCAGVNSGANRL